MSQIKITNLSFAYDGSYDYVFENVSFQIDTDWKLGFTGRNGRGKTTFLKLLMGAYTYQGTINASVHFDYFPFSVTSLNRTGLEIVADIYPPYEYWAICKELSLLDLDADVLDRPFDTLSQGERTKVLLAVLFLKENNFLLIDEPTNHLDLEGRTCVANYLKRKKGYILVSHDRLFLDHCIDHVLSINKTHIDIQKGTFSSWMHNKAYQDQFELAENQKLIKEIDRLGEAARRTAGWSALTEKSKFGAGVPDRGFVGHKAAKMMKRAKAIHQRRENAVAEKKKLLKDIETADALEIKHEAHPADVLLRIEELTAAYDERVVFEALNFTLEQGDRIAVVGGNGTGKSTLLKSVLNAIHSTPTEACLTSGSIRPSRNLIVSYVSQDTSGLSGSLDDYAKEQGVDVVLLKSMLSKLDLGPIQFEKDLSRYSEGQKKKVLMASSICERAHVYIWDEPLNYVDILSRIQIEEMLLTYQPTMLFVEHDQAFLENIATKRIVLG